ncbi:Fc.00g097000.m01.CDS01 [Cosmosporella sp. VM-42]
MEFVKPYSAEFFNTLPGLGAVASDYKASIGEEAIETVFQSLFLRYKMTKTFGLGLIHRHFDLQPDEVLVEVNGTSTAWALPTGTDGDDARGLAPGEFRKYSGRIKPHSWKAQHGGLVPYEFYFESDYAPKKELDVAGLTAIDPDFLHEFIELLKETKLDGIIGLRLLRDVSYHQVEITEGAANVTFQVNDDFAPADGNLLFEAAWMFRDTQDGSGAPVTRHCYSSCTSPSGWSHVSGHVSTFHHFIFSVIVNPGFQRSS